MMTSRLQCTKTFSLQAFQNLVARRAWQVAQYVSGQSCSFPAHRSLFKNTPSFCSSAYPNNANFCTNTPRVVDKTNVDAFDDDTRSVSAESDCSDDDIRDDEGLIPIIWDDQIPVFIHKREASVHSDVSCSSKYSISLFSEVYSSTSTVSTPASSVYNDSIVYKKSGSFGGHRGIQETMRWLLES